MPDAKMFDKFCMAFDRTTPDGWLTREEAWLLWLTALRTDGPLVEFGTYQGRSALVLLGLGRPLTCVDPWDDAFHTELKGEEIFQKFMINLYTRATQEERNLVTLGPVKVERWEPTPAGFVYCDGDHTYEGTLAQLRKAAECKPQAIAVHDYAGSGGGAEVLRACIDWFRRKPDTKVQTMAVWEGLQ